MLVPAAPKDPAPSTGLSFLAFEPGIHAAIGDRGCGIGAEQRQGLGKNPVLRMVIRPNSILIDRSLYSGIDWLSRHCTLPASGVGGRFKQVPDVGARGPRCGRDSAVPGKVTMLKKLKRDLRTSQGNNDPSWHVFEHRDHRSQLQKLRATKRGCRPFVELRSTFLQCVAGTSATGRTDSPVKGL